MKILIVDDDEIIRSGMRKMILKNTGDVHELEEFSNGLDALHYVQRNPGIHLIITDIRMPLMDGLQLIERVGELNKDIKFIVLSGYDEFNYVRKAFQGGAVDYLLKPINRQELLAHIDKIEKELSDKEQEREYEKSHQEARLSGVLESAVKNQKHAAGQLERCVDNGWEQYLIIVVEVGLYYKNSVWKKDLSGYVSTMKTIYEKGMKERGQPQILFTESGFLCSLIFLKENDRGEWINEFFHEMLDNLKESFLINMGISNPYSSFQDLNTAYQEAQEAVSFKFYAGYNKAIGIRDIEGKSIDFDYDIKPLAEDLVREVELMDYPKVRERISRFFLDVSFVKPEKIRLYIKDILYILMLRIEGFEKVLDYTGTEYNLLIGNIGTYNEMKEFILLLMKNCIQFMSAEKEKKQTQRIEMAKAYLAEHFMEALSLNDAAAYVELNPSYFSNLFKAETGMNFSEYLMKIRMEKAMQLLRNPKVRIYEIGNMVGYEDAVSFGRAFKKFVGMSPKEYRNTVY